MKNKMNPSTTPFPRQLENFLERVKEEVFNAKKKFPSPEGSMTALTEEVGELAKALLDEGWSRVQAEAIQVACMAARVAIEGDPTLIKYRAKRKKVAEAKREKSNEKHHDFKPGKTFPEACAICNVLKLYHA